MKDHVRAAVAYIAGRAISRLNASSIYDYSDRRYRNLGGSVGEDGVSVYDYKSRCHIGGSIAGLYHYGERRHINLSINGGRFSGYDYDSRRHFSGSVNGRSVSLYDYETRRYHNFVL